MRSLGAKVPGLRIPGTVDESELALRVVLGQQVSTAVARARAARLVAVHGPPATDPGGGLTRRFPSVAELSDLDPTRLGLPPAPHRTLVALVGALASGTVDIGVGADWDRSRRQVGALPGIGPGTVEMIAMRALGDPDAFPTADPGVRRGARALGLPDTPVGLLSRSQRWRPWRAYAVQYLWAATDSPAEPRPAKGTS